MKPLHNLAGLVIVAVLAACAAEWQESPAPAPQYTVLQVELHPGHTLSVNVAVQCDGQAPLVYRQVRDRQMLRVPACGPVQVGVFVGRELVWRTEHHFDADRAYRLTIMYPVQHSSVLHVRA